MTDPNASPPADPGPRRWPVLRTALWVVGKQLHAALFGVLILAAILLTRAIWQPDWALARYDALVLIAVSLQALMLALKLETWDEARVIVLFHLTGTAMEWFKVGAGSWGYPEPGVLKLFDVPLFTGFMYASVGSYIARVIRGFDMVFAPFPSYAACVALAVAIYGNFITHHYLPDIRLVLFAATIFLFWRSRAWLRLGTRWIWVPFPLAVFLASLGLWVAENIGTLTGTWAYPGQSGWEPVRWSLIGSWYLLIFVSFTTVTLVFRDALRRAPFDPSQG
ncbi:DUF817 domain-containing protein [Pseudooceanicola aestuarii]|uniref:DUF817 domain-containing protein n=1 Tax=Pseudooceanicola aestuarii TaxID=2697319 RepID=UPI0013D6799E|nr:DUF817 domain-containing protein [Pseudooceanicola aestuarii]